MAQVGSFRSEDNLDADDFTVRAEEHAWISVALDRYRGQVVDLQEESVNE